MPQIMDKNEGVDDIKNKSKSVIEGRKSCGLEAD
jgi:hypothetical protein